MFGFFKVNEDLFFEELLKDDMDIDKIEKYINKGVNINKKDEKGQTILFSLASNNFIMVCALDRSKIPESRVSITGPKDQVLNMSRSP